MWYQFILENAHFALNLFAALVMFAVFWLYRDAYKTKKSPATYLKSAGFIFLTLSFLSSAAKIESQLVSNPLITPLYHTFLISVLKIFGLLLVLFGLVFDPLQPKPGKKHVSPAIVLLFPAISLAPLVLTFNFIIPALTALVGFLYLRRATIGLENHLKSVSLAFFILSLSEITALTSLFTSTLNPDLYELVSPFGPFWILDQLLLLLACLILLKWVFSYLFKSLDTEIFFIYVVSIVIIFLTTGITFSALLVKNVENDSFGKITTQTKVLKFALNSKSEELLSDSQSLAQNPEILASFTDVTKLTLKNLTQNSLNSKKLDSVIVVNENGQVLMRAQNPEHFGDSLSSDTLVKKALLGDTVIGASQKEGILAPLISISAASPVKNEQSVAGAVISSITVDNAFVDGIKKATGLEASIYAGQKISATTLTNYFDATRLLGLTEKNAGVLSVLDGKNESFTGIVKIAGIDYLASFLPIKDSDGNPVGLLSAQKPHVEVLKTAGASLAITFFTTIILIIISTLPAKMISNFIIKQIK